MVDTVHFVLGLFLSAVVVQGYPTGPPLNDEGVCINMYPKHDEANAQVVKSPYKIEVNPKEYSAGSTVKVTISGDNIKGFMIVGRRFDQAKNQDDILGHFTALDGTKTKKLCATGGQGSALSHSEPVDKDKIELEWIAPGSFEGHIEFKVTIVKQKHIFWVQELSDVLRDSTAGPIPTRIPSGETIIIDQPVIPPYNPATCGSSKGCFRDLENCREGQCNYMVTWTDGSEGFVDFEVYARLDDDHKYVAVAFSHDKDMGDDSVVECVFNARTSRVEVYLSYNNKADPPNNERIAEHNALSGAKGRYGNSSIKCTFSRAIEVIGNERIKPLITDYYIMMAKGPADGDVIKQHDFDHSNGPIVSPVKANLRTFSNIAGRATYPLVKAHGILMILAWVLTASIAIIFARYYKPMWPNDRLCGERVWFANHRTLQINTLILTIIAFILIFVEVMGYSNMSSPGITVAHPIIGIIVTCLCVLNPILALFRCHPEDDMRPCFNWMHWLFGTVAHILATINIFFGMNLAKSGVPWWVTWVMFVWVLIQFITEITLEIHQCCMHKRNKDKREQWEMHRKTDPRGDLLPEPEPKGRRFKSTCLTIYIILTVILVLIMVIAIAVA